MAILVLLVLGTFAYALGLSFFTVGWSADPNYRNVTIDTRVNITGSAPVIVMVAFPTPVTLGAGTITPVTCNVSIRDYNGFGDLSVVNATLFHQASSEAAADENNTHYTNASCSFAAGSGYYANYTCTFPVNYYALNGTWNCSARVNDSINLRGVGTNKTTLSAVYALNITQTLLDYGNLSAGEYSDNVTANISNLGNLNINVSVFGYGRTMGDGLAFVCDYGNFTINMTHFAANSTASYFEKQNLTSSYQSVFGLTINKTNDAAVSLNSTYWEFYADPQQIAYGQCNGTIIFQATAP